MINILTKHSCSFKKKVLTTKAVPNMSRKVEKEENYCTKRQDIEFPWFKRYIQYRFVNSWINSSTISSCWIIWTWIELCFTFSGRWILHFFIQKRDNQVIFGHKVIFHHKPGEPMTQKCFVLEVKKKKEKKCIYQYLRHSSTNKYKNSPSLGSGLVHTGIAAF